MKRILFLILTMVSVAMPIFAVSTARCLLQHKGSVKIFEANAIDTAIKNAADGDTIFLTEGTFPGFTVNKKITVRGAGQNSEITGNISIAIAGIPTLTQTVLEGLDLNSNNVILDVQMNGLKIKQCQMGSLTTKANNDDVIIDRCNISNCLNYSSFIQGMTVINSAVQIGKGNSSTDCPVSFVNCNVVAYYVNYCTGTFINCLIRGYDYGSNRQYNNCDFVNCLFYGSYTDVNTATCSLQNCYKDTSNTSWDVNTLQNKGYLGNDYRVVGCLGGANPYSLELAVPKVTESTLVLDPEKKTLTVSLKVSAN